MLHRSTKTGDLIHLDLGGGGKIPRGFGSQARYWMIDIDDFDGWGDVQFTSNKHHVTDLVINISKRYINERELAIKAFVTLDLPPLPASRPEVAAFQSDNGGEFDNYRLQKWAKETNTRLYFSALYAYGQNGKVERMMRII